VRATVDKATVWIDPTMSQLGGDPRDRDLSDFGAVLPVVAGTTALQEIVAPAKRPTALRILETYLPQEKDGGVRLEIQTTYEGALADAVRMGMSQARREDVLRSRADYFRRRYGELDTVGTLDARDDRERNTYAITETFLLKHPFEAGVAAPTIEVYASALSDPSELPETMHRTGPLAVGTPGNYRHEIRVQVPEGWHPTFSADDDARASQAFAYSRKVSIDKKQVTLVYDMTVSRDELDAANASTHLGELRHVRDEISAVLRFQSDKRLDVKDRDERLKALLRDLTDEGKSQ
jgi:hypothetical protein